MRAIPVLLLVGLVGAPGASAQRGPVNLDFEDASGRIGRLPTGWFVPTQGYQALLTDERPQQGERCVRLASTDAGERAPFGNIMQAVDAGPYRGKVIRLRAAVRVEGAGATGRAQMWLRVDREKGRRGLFDNMGDRPIAKASWGYYEIVGDVALDAQRINFGLMLLGAGRVWLDDVSVEIVGEAGGAVAGEPPRSLEGRALENLVAFTRLLGYVRYFHPSDEAAKADWEALVVTGVREVESAASAAELVRLLERQFRPVAPTVRVFSTGKRPPIPQELKPPSGLVGLRVRTWHHRGIGMGTEQSVYRSWRGSHDAADEDLPEGTAEPAVPFVADLGGGVSCMVPLALFADEQGTLPQAAAAAANADDAPMRTGAERYSGDDRATRLGAVALAWNVFQHFYPYFDVVDTDWPQALRTALTSAATDADERAFLDTLRRMVVRLHDGHGQVWHPSDDAGASLPIAWDWAEDRLVVTAVDATQAGGAELRRGDVVVKIDGRPAAAALADAEALISGATPQWRRYRALNDLRSGAPETQVVLEIDAGEEKTRTVTLTRSASASSVEEPRPEKLTEIEPGVLYVDIGRITDTEFRAAFPRLEKAKGIVFDFRGYPAQIQPQGFFPHIIDKPATSAQWHVPIIRRPDGQGMRYGRVGEWFLSPRAPRFKAKLAFITDGRAISYAESCLGIVEHYKLGEIVGGPTAGTNGNVNPFTLPGGYRVVWTGMKVLKHDGSQHHGVGILPTVPVSRTVRGIAAGRDEFLERAVAVVSE